MANYTGTAGDDDLVGTTGSDFFDLQAGGIDIAHGGAGDDDFQVHSPAAFLAGSATFYGEDGRDDFFLNDLYGGLRFTVYGGADADIIRLQSGTGTIVDAGDGDDAINHTGGDGVVTLGAGHDYVSTSNNLGGPGLTITDFSLTGDSADRLDISGAISGTNPTWNDAENPFTAGFASLVQSGADTLVQVRRNGWTTVITLQNVNASDLTALHFSGYDPAGGPNVGMTFDGTDAADFVRGLAGDDVLNGGGGDDSLSGGPGSDELNGGEGHDILNDDRGASLVMRGGDGDDSLDVFRSINQHVAGTLLLSGGAGNDVISGAVFSTAYMPGDIVFQGDDGNDFLVLQGRGGSLEGGAGNDTLNGGDGDDTLNGGSGDDALNGGAGVDTASYAGGASVKVDLTILSPQNTTGAGIDTLSNIENLIGSSGSDTLRGDDGANQIAGGAGLDFLWGAGGNDTLLGEAGNDFLLGGLGDDLLDGGADVDYASYQELGDTVVGNGHGVTVSLTISGAQDTIGAGLDTLIGIENLIGSQYDDVLTGNDSNNLIAAAGGNNILNGLGGNDNLWTSLGDDVLNGGDGTDTANYSNIGIPTSNAIAQGGPKYLGNGLGITLTIGVAGPQQTGGAGADTLISIESVVGSQYADTIIGDANNNVIQGVGGDDTLDGGLGSDVLLGGAGDDVLKPGKSIGFADADQLDGGAGNDTASFADSYPIQVSLAETSLQFVGAGYVILTSIENLIGSNNSQFGDKLTGNDGANRLYGLAGADLLIGGAGDDILIGGDDADTLDGGDGIDTASYEDQTSGVRVSLTPPLAEGVGNPTYDDFISIENLTGSAFADTLTGDNGVNVLSGGAGNDNLYGKGGDDLLIGGAGNDLLDGGDGADTASFADNAGGVNVNLFLGFGPIVASGAGDTLVSIENLIGSNFADHFFGDDGVNVFDGGGGDDFLFGLGGDDVLKGGAGADALDGGLGADVLDGGDGIDTANYLNETAGVTVTLSSAPQPSGSGAATGDILISIENITGSAYADTLKGDGGANGFNGSAGDDVLMGEGGNDDLYGGDGDDLLFGGLGDDVINGGMGDNTVSYGDLNGGQGVTVSLALFGAQDTGGAGVDALSLVNKIIGSQYADVLTGNGFKNVITGGNGNDTLDGGAGDDTLDGGSGVDIASYANATGAVNVNLRTGKAAGAAGNDTLIQMETVIGSAFADSLTSSASGAGSVLRGMGGDDVFYFGAAAPDAASAETFDGGDGMDMISLESATSAVTANLLTGHVQTPQNEANFTGIEGLIGSGYGDTLTGDGGANVLIGGDGNDTLIGGAGADRLYGGVADDTFIVDSQADLVFELAGEGTDTVVSTADFYLYDNIETLNLATGGGDILGVGNSLANLINGNEGNNLLLGGGGNDTVFGGAGDDRLFGEAGDDILNGDAGADTVVGGLGNDTVNGGSGADHLYGEDGDDILTGGTGVDVLVGGAGNDTLIGSSQILREQDFLYGGAGDDTYVVDGNQKLTFEDVGGGNDTVVAYMSGSGIYLYANVENLTLASTTGYGVGNELDNVITGNASANWLLGGAGNDTLNGKAGGDVLFGQGGADTFVFEHGTGGDVIGDFTVGVDKVSLAGIYGSFAEVQSHMVQNGGDSAIDLGQGDLVVFQHVAMNAFTAGDFLF